jgi:hypothetical protein
MWRLTLSKLSLQEHAAVAPTCRDFQEEPIARVAKGRAACILAAEDTLGKGLFTGFVTVARRLLCGLGPYPGGSPLVVRGDTLIIDAAGTAEYVEGMETLTRWSAEKQAASVWQNHWSCPLFAELCPTRAGKADIIISVDRHPGHSRNMVHWSDNFTKEKAGTAMGLMLAICTGDPEATPAHWKMGFGGVTLEQFSWIDIEPAPLT